MSQHAGAARPRRHQTHSDTIAVEPERLDEADLKQAAVVEALILLSAAQRERLSAGQVAGSESPPLRQHA